MNRRVEWIAVLFTISSFFMMMISYSIFYSQEAWGVFTITMNLIAVVVFLFTIIISLFGKEPLSKLSLSLGIIFLMVTIVSIGVRMMDIVSNSWYML